MERGCLLRVKEFRKSKQQGELFVKEQMVNTIAQVITNYHNIVRQKQQLKAIREQMGVSEERVKLAEPPIGSRNRRKTGTASGEG